MASRFAWVFFDLGGTLIDTGEVHMGGFKYAFRELLGEEPSGEALTRIARKPLDTRLQTLLAFAAPGTRLDRSYAEASCRP